ncbi:MAG: IS110 family transposase [Acetobacteraceae bacterium]|nr:IS110 family transposase [Acetobacteraceae bacterium]
MYFCGLDVSLRMTAVCVVDGDGRILKEAKVASDPEVISEFLRGLGLALERVGLEAGATAAWLQAGLREHGWPTVCIDARHAAAALQAGLRNKSDRNDARGIAQLMRLNAFRPVWVKSLRSQRINAMLTARNTIQEQLVRIENVIRGLLRGDGVVLPLGRARFEAEIREQLGGEADLLAIVEPLLAARAEMLRSRTIYDGRIMAIARKDPVCRLLMTAPAVGPHVALAFRAGVDDPARFRRSRTVGAHFGLSPRRYSSGEIDHSGRISRMGDRHVRHMLYVAAQITLRRDQGLWSSLKAWALRVGKARGMAKARVALARKLACVLHKMWVTGEPFRWQAGGAAKAA